MKNKLLFIIITVLYIPVISWVIQMRRGNEPKLDQWSGKYVDRFEDSFVFDFFRSITDLGSRSFLIPFTILVAIILWIVLKDWLVALFFAGGTLISHLLNMLIKEIVARERPSILVEANAEGFSFPSGHSMITMVCYGLLMYFLVKTVKRSRNAIIVQAFFALLIFLIGSSRYVINVHYATDILSGFLIGFTLLIGFIYLFEWIDQNRRRSQSQS